MKRFMKKGIELIILSVIILVFCAHSYAQQGNKKTKLPDTNGLANIEGRLDDFKPIVQNMAGKIDKCGGLDTIKQYASILEQISDTIMNHMVPIFDGFYALHPDQYQPLKNISDLSENILKSKDIIKAKKYDQKIMIEYASLIKAK